MAPKKQVVVLTALTFNPRSVAYSFGMLANLSDVKLSYFVDDEIDAPVMKSETETITGFVEVAQKLKQLSESELQFFKKIIPLCYTAPLLADLEEILSAEVPEEPTMETYLVLGSPAVVDCEDLSAYPKIQALAAKFEKNAVIKASKGQVAVAFKKYEQLQAKSGPTLPHAEMGKVCTRFPPEPSGYLHIGHSKAALLNYYFAKKYEGRLHFRLDDTNPAKENPDFVQSIQNDLETLGVKYDTMSYTSDSFQMIQDLCESMIKKGQAYCDKTIQAQMQQERADGTESAFRNNSVEENLRLWEQMKIASPEGQLTCVRAKADMQNPNKCMRDFVIYRVVLNEHHRTGDKFKIYPTYDFACPIVDSVEGITHALRTTEFLDRNEQYQWICNVLGLRCPYIQDFSRLRLQYSLMSKRHLQWFVDQKIVDNWKDPRFPTVQGLMRRGLLVQSITDFIVSQGASRRLNYQEWSKLWALNKQYLEPIAKRFHCVLEDHVVMTLDNIEDKIIEVPLHPKNKDAGMKKVHISKSIHITKADLEEMQKTQAQKVTLMNIGNFTVNGQVLTYLPGDTDFSNTIKLTWLPNEEMQKVTLRYYGQLVTKAILGPEDDFKNFVNPNSLREFTAYVQKDFLTHCQQKSIVQLERMGFYYVDQVEGGVILHYVPEGKKQCQVGAFAFDEE
ncbi:Glutamate-tRNA_ligase [Hexamita inflata]|uniref:glutamate--tRNA ligase n=1 Tax=Hexamita inflata TaxID=28002 RepID=A0AA86QIU3_9EUKA|nr:Glutamate-tRNA ligase [Hexamita inflata]